MRRITLLLFVVIPVFLQSQNTEILQHKIQNTTQALEKSELVGMGIDQLVELGHVSEENLRPTRPNAIGQGDDRDECFDVFIPVDPLTYTAVPRNDDLSLYIGNIGFTFNFCGNLYTDVFLNTNGNLSFGEDVGQFSPDGFPIPELMIAPFWADVDTRNTACGQIWYRLFPNYMIVTWEDVGWFNQQCNPVNTFQVIISDGTAPIIGAGNNIQFRYGDMNWTTGTASGGGPFGGSPATVGYNTGDNVNFEQVGRFNEDNANYDGPFGNFDGVHWLDNKCFSFDASGGAFTLECTAQTITRTLDANCSASITPEEIATTFSSACSSIDLSLDISTFGCNNIGQNVVTVTATSGGQTETCTAIINILEGACSASSIAQVGPYCEDDFPVTLLGSPPGGTWGGAAGPFGNFDPSAAGPGPHVVTYTNPNACPPTASINIMVNSNPEVMISPDPPEFCVGDGFVELVAMGSGGDGNYNYSWTTPFGNQSGSSIFATLAGAYSVSVSDGNGCGSLAFTDVIIHPDPDVVIPIQGPFCNTENSVQLSAFPVGGVWSGPFITPDGFILPQSLPPGSFPVTYTYTNNFNCSASYTENIQIIATPDAIASNNGPYCEGTPIEIFGNTNATGNITYSWTGPNNYTSSAQNPTDATEAGGYILEVSLDGCPSILTPTVVEVLEAPIAVANNTGPYCPGQTITLIGAASTTGNVISYQWSGPNAYSSTEANPTDATEEGIYIFSVTVDGCPSEQTSTLVTFTAAPDITTTNSGPYCIDDPIELFGSTTSNGTSIIYNWTGPNGYVSSAQNPDDATEPGTYSLDIDVDGCLSSVSSTVVIYNAPPEPVILGDNAFCEGENSLLDAGAGYNTYAWSDGTSNQSTLVDQTTIISVTVTDANGCTGETSFSVTENQNPVPDITGSTSFCTGSSTILDAGSGFDSYVWSNTASSQSIEVTTPGDYSVIVTNANGCTGEVMVSVEENDLLSPVIAGDLNLCQGENSTLDAGTGFETYIWSDGTETQTIDVNTNGNYAVTVTDANGCTGENEVSLVVNNNPAPNISGDNTFCEGLTTSLDADGGFSNYIWSEGSSTSGISVDATGTYSVTVTDANDCTGEAQFSVTENQNPSPTITGDDEFCTGESVSLDAGDPFDQYIWSEGSTTQTIDISDGTTYSVTVTDANSCTGETSIDVNENTITPPSITGDLSFCNGGDSNLDAGTGYNSYTWSDGTSNQSITVSTTGTYSVIVTDINGCTSEDEVSVNVNDNPVATIDGAAEFCEGASSSLNAGTGFSEYLWSDGSVDQMLDVSTNGTYSVTVTDANGCTNEDQINIAVNDNPTPEIAGSSTFCSGFSTTLDAGTGFSNYEWSGGSGDQTLEVSVDGSFTVTVTDINGCTGEASIDIEESTSLNPAISGDIEYCVGNTTTLDAGAGFETYTWSDGTGEQTISVNTPDDYSVTVTDANGCSGETTVSVAENQLPVLSILGNDPICTGENITLDAGSGFDNYEWSDLSLNQTIQVNTGGTYSVIVTDANGCMNQAQVTVLENSNPSPLITGDQAFCSDETASLDAGTFNQYIWSQGSTSQNLDVTMGGTYSVTVTDTNGCTGEDQITVSENQLPMPEITGDLAFCTGSTVTLNGPVGFDYQWSDGSSSQTITIGSGGIIDLTVTDVNGCTGATSVTIAENPNPEPSIAGSTTFCTGNTTTIDAGMGYDQYLWSDASLNQTLEVTLEGDYAVTVTDVNGCTGETQISIAESQSLEPVIAGDSDVCTGETSIFDAGSGFTSYNWSDGSIGQSITVDTEGEYTVTVSDSEGCTGETTLSLIVNQNPLATISGVDNFCEGDLSILDAGSGYDLYSWSNGETSQTIEVTTNGIFTVTITDANGCVDETQIDVTVFPIPVPQITGPSSFCSGNTATLDAGSGFDSYSWSNGETSQSISIEDGNLYTVTVSSAGGCTEEASIDVIENASLTPVILGDVDFCEGDNSILDAGVYATYEWSTGEVTPNITVTENGNYGVLVTDADGCSGSSNVVVSTFQNPDPIIAGSSTFCTGSQTTLDAGNYESFLWSNGETVQTITINTPGTYLVDVTDQNGCAGTASINVTESTSLNPVISGEAAICIGGNTILDAGAGFATYLWSDGSTNQTLEVGAASDYGVTVSDASGCSGETFISVIQNTPPVVDLASGPTLCNTDAGGSVTNLFDLINAGDMSGTWEDTDNSGAFGLFDDLNFNGITAGDYTFTYTTNSALSPCEEVSYPITITIMDCACAGISFNTVDPLCNSDETLDLNSVLSFPENGNWSIISAPPGTSPAVISAQVFDATAADPGTYELQFELIDTPPPGCPDQFNLFINIDPEVNAGTADLPLDFCADESQAILLSDLLNGELPGGAWTETSGAMSQNGAFDPSSAIFNMAGQNNGVYNFEYTIESGGACPDNSEVVSVIVNELPTVIAGASVELDCINPVLSLNAAGSSNGSGFDLQWSGDVVIDGNENTITPTVNQSGNYVLTITNLLTGCSATDEVTVTESADIPIASAGGDAELTCDNTEISLQAGGSTGDGFEVEWQGPSINTANMNDENPTVDLAGIYILTISNSNNGCVSSPDTVIISNNSDAPELSIELPLSLNCTMEEVPLIGSSANPAVDFEWFDGPNSIGNNAAIDGIDAPGFYTLVVTDTQTGCSGSETIEVFQDTISPFADAGFPQTIDCYNPIVGLDGSASQNGSNILYEWTGPGISGATGEVEIDVNLPGSYSILVTNLDNGCETSAMVQVDENTTPPQANILEPEQLDCTIEEVTLDGTGSSLGNNFIYSWTDPQGNPLSTATNVNVQSIGTYTLSILDTNNGCENSTNVVVTQNMNVPSSADFLISDPDCYGDEDGTISLTQVFGGMPPYVYSINDEVYSTNGFYSGLAPGNYDISLQDANGCEWDTTINILQPIDVDITLGTDLFLELGDSATVEAQINIPIDQVDTIIWSPSNLINCGDPDCLEIGFSSFLSQDVSATLIDLNGCVAEDRIMVVMDKERKVFIPNIFTPNGDNENESFMIFADGDQVVQVNKFMVFNRWGEMVYEGLNFQPNDPDYSWDGKFRDEILNPGVFVYLAEIEFIDGEIKLYKGDVTLMR